MHGVYDRDLVQRAAPVPFSSLSFFPASYVPSSQPFVPISFGNAGLAPSVLQHAPTRFPLQQVLHSPGMKRSLAAECAGVVYSPVKRAHAAGATAATAAAESLMDGDERGGGGGGGGGGNRSGDGGEGAGGGMGEELVSAPQQEQQRAPARGPALVEGASFAPPRWASEVERNSPIGSPFSHRTFWGV
jgi:hypothetical protein